jgi:hypothetical protein
MSFPSRFTPLVLTLAACTLSAQETTGTVTGHILAKGGAPIVGATVRISSPAMLGERVAITDAAGQYRIPLIPNGMYSMSVSAKACVTTKANFKVLAGQTTKTDVILPATAEVNKVQEAVVEVMAVSAQVDKTDTVTQTNMSVDSINQLMSNNLEAILWVAPGVANAGFRPRIRGGGAASTKWLLNGTMVNDQAWGYDNGDTTIQDMLESVALVESPLNARYGNTDGGIVSMVTTRGSNEFTGSFRAKLSTYGWYGPISGANQVPYNSRTGYAGGTYTPQADDSLRTFDVTLRGPIWRDHITFAFGGTYTPRTNSTTGLTRLLDDPAIPENKAGTFFQLPNGSILRRASLYEQGQQVPSNTKSTYNQFVLYWQLTTNHQIEWNYTQNDYRDFFYGWTPIDSHNGSNQDGQTTRMFTLAYKGIIGSHGVLEARYGKTFRWWPHPVTPGRWPIGNRYEASVVPKDDGSYMENSIYPLHGSTTAYTNGSTYDRGDTFYDTTLAVNYQHLLDWHGNHVFDMGFEAQKFQWNTQILDNVCANTFYTAGQLANDYTLAETGGIDPATVNGKYIVYTANATVGDVGGPGDPSALLWNKNRGLIPHLIAYRGNDSGTYWQPTTSIYLNDLWSINNNHSIMLGVRHDIFKLEDGTGLVHDYSVNTPRFEYKWDVNGDQARVVNLSYAQFHDRFPCGQFQQFVTRRLAYRESLYWTGADTPNPDRTHPNAPYLVDQSAILDPGNYTRLSGFSGPGTFVLDSGWKAPIAVEYVLGLRRNYPSGLSWRISAIYKSWRNLFDNFPVWDTSQKAYVTAQLADPDNPAVKNTVYQRVMRRDPDSFKNYKAFEAEWSVPLSKKLTMSGNYTFSRTLTNATDINDTPVNSTPYGNFRNFYSQYFDRSAYNPALLQDPEHNAKIWFVYDLSVDRIKSSCSFMASYISGNPDSRTVTYQIGYPTFAGATQPSGLNNTVTTFVGNGNPFTMQYSFTTSFKYDVEVQVDRRLKAFLSLQVNNLFNTILPGWNGISPYDINETYGTPTYEAHGWRASSDVSNAGVGSARSYPRTVTLETGLRF